MSMSHRETLFKYWVLFAVSIAVGGVGIDGTVVARINCGGGVLAAEDGGRNWTADNLVSEVEFTETTPFAIPTGALEMYRTMRVDRSPGDPLSYTIPVPPGMYSVRLHFNDFLLEMVAFNITAGEHVQNTFATGFDPKAVFGATTPGQIHILGVVVDDGSGLTIELHSVVGGSLINGIEVVQFTTPYPPAPQLPSPACVNRSALSCGDLIDVVSTALPWNFHRGQTDVCGTSFVSPTSNVCVTNATLEEARADCAGEGGRLCTLAEVMNDATAGSGCGFDGRRVWSSTTCNGGAYTVGGSSNTVAVKPAECTLETTRLAVRCCADRELCTDDDTAATVEPGSQTQSRNTIEPVSTRITTLTSTTVEDRRTTSSRRAIPRATEIYAQPTTESPTSAPTVSPTSEPTESLSSAPTTLPTSAPTASPTSAPTASPISAPTESTSAPTASPTSAPTASPTSAPTALPTSAPTPSPTSAPTPSPTSAPTESPSSAPTALPIPAPTVSPTSAPVTLPTSAPTTLPTSVPTAPPTSVPTASPTSAPTALPTSAPTSEPTGPCGHRATEVVSGAERFCMCDVGQVCSGSACSTAFGLWYWSADEICSGCTCSPPSPPPPGACIDVLVNGGEAWADSDGFPCDWYASDPTQTCSEHGLSFAANGHTASTACCVCRGESPSPLASPCYDISLNSNKPWHDVDSVEYTCQWYEYTEHACALHSDGFAFEGLTARRACCACGGGVGTAPSPPITQGCTTQLPTTATTGEPTTTLPDACTTYLCSDDCSGSCGWSRNMDQCVTGGRTTQSEVGLGQCNTTAGQSTVVHPFERLCLLNMCSNECNFPCGWSSKQTACVYGGKTTTSEVNLGIGC